MKIIDNFSPVMPRMAVPTMPKPFPPAEEADQGALTGAECPVRMGLLCRPTWQDSDNMLNNQNMYISFVH